MERDSRAAIADFPENAANRIAKHGNSSMNVLLVWDADYPWDIRVDKVATTLVQAGHSVVVACRNIGRRPLDDAYNGARICRLPVLPRWSATLNEALSFPAFFSPIWINHIHRAAARCEANLIVVRDLPMAPAALLVARRLRIPCVLDMAECYPEMLRCIWKYEGIELRNVLLRNPYLADIVERFVVNRVDEIWVMVEESRERLLRKGVAPERIRIISNTPTHRRFAVEARPKREGRLALIYVGLLNPSRGIDTAIQGVAKFREAGGDCEFVIAGDGKARARLEKLASELGVAEHVKFLGWIDNAKVPALIGVADVGIVPHHRCSHWETTIPNKLFDYMAAGLPVVVSDVGPAMRIVQSTKSGIVYRDHDGVALSRVLEELTDAEGRRRMGERGRAAVRETYHWGREEKVLLRSVEELTGIR